MNELAQTSRPIFDARGLTKVYEMGEVRVEALRGVDLDIHAGEFLVLLGPSGSGKSTLLNILGGLDVPTGGTMRYRDHDLTVDDDAAMTRYRREHVGFVFQFYNLIPSLTARENIDVVAELSPGALPADEVLGLVGLGARAEHFPSELSGGEQQRVAIARALVKRPPLMLCDEPTGALDLNTGILTLQALLDANRRFGTTMLIVTHNADIARIADRVIHFADGRIRSITANPELLDPAQLHW